MNRRSFVKSAGAAALLGGQTWAPRNKSSAAEGKIDRHALIDRHKITLTKPDALTPLSVGNGEFAFTADVTGMQTFTDFHHGGMHLQTMAQWGWHTTP
ncbi:MAG: hypothetical protein ACRYFS_21380, partial [Janthinobacterium lividum]